MDLTSGGAALRSTPQAAGEGVATEEGATLKVVLKDSRFGKGIFAVRPIDAQEVILQCGGALLTKAELPVPYTEACDHYTQIGDNLYLGPSGLEDDYINHSCAPNGWLKIDENGVFLIALRAIVPGEEVTFDYSTTMQDDEWVMRCGCGAPECRGAVANFSTLPRERQEHYRALGIVPGYIR